MKYLKKNLRNLLLFVFLLGLFMSVVLHTAAQSEDEVWDAPVNLSQSGSATGLAFTVDISGTYHLLWQDEFVGYEYLSGNGEDWSEPSILLLPFSEPPFTAPGDESFENLFSPLWVADAEEELIHGFWQGEEGVLWYSRSAIAELTTRAGWTARARLAPVAIAHDVAVDANGRLHLVYIRPKTSDETTAGLYYRLSDDAGETWTDAVQLYQSDYYHVDASDQAHVKIVAAEDGRIYTVWDNRLLDRVFITYLLNDEETWAEPILVDQQTFENDGEDRPGPSRIDIALVADEVHLTWQASDEEQKCAQYHTWSTDQGQSWQPQQVVITRTTCPTDGQFIVRDDVLFLLTRIDTEANLQVWDGRQWSEHTLQPLVNFTDPDTFRTVTLDCLHISVSSNSRLAVFGCGTSIVSQDIWLLQRPLGGLEEWADRFSATPVWSTPEALVQSDVHLQMPQLVVGADGRIHGVWSETGNPVAGDFLSDSALVGQAVYYSQLNADSWLPPRVLVESSNNAKQPSLAAGADGSLYLAWSGGEANEITLRRAFANRAASVGEWFEPQILSGSQAGGEWPSVVTTGENEVLVVYSVPLNEERGLYLTRSEDGGLVWSTPERIFDGHAADWEMVGRPHLIISDESTFHLLWTRHTASQGAQPLALYYAQSQDGGQTWSEPEVVVEGTIIWSEIIAINELHLHRAWVDSSNDLPALWYQQTLDGGITWSEPLRLSDPSVRVGPTTLIRDSANEPHVLMLGKSSLVGAIELKHWSWRDGRWNQEADIELDEEMIDADGLAAAMGPDGLLAVILSSLVTEAESGRVYNGLFSSNRQWEQSESVATPVPTLTPTPQVTPTETPPPGPSPTPTVIIPMSQDDRPALQIGPIDTGTPTGLLILGVLPAALIVIIATAIALRIRRNR
ncbi:MAG: exo-alpha-sialidase [Anaerolineaceae bacterium]|nr:exo-alpha-sialidase [Anaerolineaceae bacterium]